MRIHENCDDFIARKQEEFKNHKLKRKPITLKDIGRRGKHSFHREGWAFVPQQDNPRKVFLIEKLCFQRVEGRPSRQCRAPLNFRTASFSWLTIHSAENASVFEGSCPRGSPDTTSLILSSEAPCCSSSRSF